MLQLETFPLKDSKKANEFIKEHRLIENGLQVRENTIVVLYDEATHFDAKSKEVALIMKLSSAEANLLAGEIEKEFFELMEAGDKMTAEAMAARDKNLGQMAAVKAQIFVLKRKLGRDAGEGPIFGKKVYKEKKAK